MYTGSSFAEKKKKQIKNATTTTKNNTLFFKTLCPDLIGDCFANQLSSVPQQLEPDQKGKLKKILRFDKIKINCFFFVKIYVF